jgi:uncharacterized membrane protein YcgQ (UPF0703/DUF1980 family)
VGVLVQVAPGVAAANEDWVEVEGTLSSSARDGASLISVVATRVTATNEPPAPYLQSL